MGINIRFGPAASASAKWGQTTRKRVFCEAMASSSFIKGEEIERAVDIQLRDSGDGMRLIWFSIRMAPTDARELATAMMRAADRIAPPSVDERIDRLVNEAKEKTLTEQLSGTPLGEANAKSWDEAMPKGGAR